MPQNFQTYEIALNGTVGCSTRRNAGAIRLEKIVSLPFIPVIGWLLSDGDHWQAEVLNVDLDISTNRITVILDFAEVDENLPLDEIKNEMEECLKDYLACGWVVINRYRA